MLLLCCACHVNKFCCCCCYHCYCCCCCCVPLLTQGSHYCMTFIDRIIPLLSFIFLILYFLPQYQGKQSQQPSGLHVSFLYRAIYFKRANDESLFLILLEAWNHFFYTPCFFLFEMDYDSGTVTSVLDHVLDHVDASLEQSNNYSIRHRNRVYCCIDI